MSKNPKKKAPKTVAGIKVPAALRNTEWIAAALSSPLVREAMAAALVAGAGAAAAVLTRKAAGTEPVRKAGGAVVETGAEATSVTKDLTSAAVGALAGMATEAVKTLVAKSDGKKARKEARKDKAADIVGSLGTQDVLPEGAPASELSRRDLPRA